MVSFSPAILAGHWSVCVYGITLYSGDSNAFMAFCWLKCVIEPAMSNCSLVCLYRTRGQRLHAFVGENGFCVAWKNVLCLHKQVSNFVRAILNLWQSMAILLSFCDKRYFKNKKLNVMTCWLVHPLPPYGPLHHPTYGTQLIRPLITVFGQ